MVNPMRRSLITNLFVALSLPLVVLAGTQGPDAGGYSATDSAAFSFIDISTGGGGTSILSATDDGTVLVSMPFSFPFYGTSYTQVCVGTNGAAYFLSDPAVCATIADFANTDLTAGAPIPDLPAILPFWTDLTFQTPGSGSVFYQTLGTAPNRRFIIQWSQAYPQGSGNPVTFQAILTETSGAISFQYQTVALGAGNPASSGGQATVGIRNAGAQTNGQQLQWSFSVPVLADSLALAFTRGTGPLPPALTSPSNGAFGVATSPLLSWVASGTATSYDVFLGTTNPPVFAANVVAPSWTPTGLTAGTTYNWQVIAKNAAGSAASAMWLFTTAAPPSGGGGGGGTPAGSSLTVTPDTLTLKAPAGGGPVKQTVLVSWQTYTEGAPTFSTSRSTNQGLGWLSVSPATGTMTQASYSGFLYTYTATIEVSADPAGVAAGTVYTGTVNVLAGSGVGSTTVTMDVISQPAEFTLLPKTLSFLWRKGDTKIPDAQSVTLTSRPTATPFSAAASTSAGGNWLRVTPASGASPSALSVGLNSAILGNLVPGTYTGKVTVSGGTAVSVELPVSLTVIRPDAPAITQGGIVPLYGDTPVVQSGTWVSIYGTNLAPAAAVWNGDFPTTLGGVSVKVNNRPAYLWFVSPLQINLQLPDDTATGTVSVELTTPTGVSTSSVTLAAASPSFSLLGDGARHAAAVILTPDNSGAYASGAYDLMGPTGAFTYSTRPVRPGENLILFGVGFGPTSPVVAAGASFSGAARTINPVDITIGGVAAEVSFAGLTAAGLYQFNVIVPTVGSGEQPLRATINGVRTPAGPLVTVR